MPQPDLEWRKREISALVNDVGRIERELAVYGVNAIDEFDRMEAMDIIRRIERKMLANHT